jgi:hypothetical protein
MYLHMMTHLVCWVCEQQSETAELVALCVWMCCLQVANGIPIESWYDDPEDNELMQLLPFLEDISHIHVTDVRPAITSRYNLPAKVQEASMRLMNSVAAAAAAAHQQQQREREQRLQQQAAEQQRHQRSLVMQAATTAAVLQPQMAVHQQLQPPVSQPQVQQA